MYLKYLYLQIYLHYKFRSSTVTDKQNSVSLNVMSVHLAAFVGFINFMFIRHRSRHHTSELSVMAVEMFSSFFSCKEIILAEQISQ